MRVSTMLAGLALCVVVGAGCKGTANKSKDNNAPQIHISASVLPDRSIAKVSKLAVKKAGGQFLTLSRTSSGWRIVTASESPADTRAVEMALRELERMELAKEPVAKDKSGWAEYGVGPGEAIELEAHIGAAQPFVVHLGRKGYVRIGGDARVYRAYHISYFTFARELRFWRARGLLSLPLGAVSEVAITKGTATARAKRTGTGPNDPWTLTEGKDVVGAFDPAAPGSTATRLGTLIAHDLVAAGTVAAGLDKPRVIVVLRTADATYTVKVGATIDAMTYLGLVGDERILAVKNQAIAWLLDGPASWRKP